MCVVDLVEAAVTTGVSRRQFLGTGVSAGLAASVVGWGKSVLAPGLAEGAESPPNSGGPGSSGVNFSDNRNELARALRNVTVLLEDGVSASEHHGLPISAKYEVDGGRLQLSVYTTANDQFWEVIVDHTTGNVRGAGPIRGKEELATAQSQKTALANATFPLKAAIAEAVRGAPGYRAVSAVPTLDEGRPLLTVILVSGSDWKSVSLGLEK